MKKDIHPKFHDAKITCSGCGNVYTMGSTEAEISVSVCSNCHPFFTGKQKLLDSEGRVDRFRKKYAKFTANAEAAKVAQVAAK